eukprot:Hpha_TRINITY_DN15964_c1_g3::TRINITY_DN15964_c1_g3_i1::g.73474::m.73474
MSGRVSYPPLDHILSASTRSPFLKVIAAVVNSAVVDARDAVGTPFDARTQPGIPLYDYLRRWVRHTRCEASCVVAAVMLVDRVCMLSGFPVTALNVHRLLLAALTVSNKYCLDIPFLNSHYARVGGVSVEELNALERQLLQLLEFDVHLEKEEFQCYVQMFRNNREWPIEWGGGVAAQEATRRQSEFPRRQSEHSSTVTMGLTDSERRSSGLTDRRLSDQTDRRFSNQTDRRSSDQTERRSLDQRDRTSSVALLPVPPSGRPSTGQSDRRQSEQTDRRSSEQTDRMSSDQTERRSDALLPAPPSGRPPAAPSWRRQS